MKYVVSRKFIDDIAGRNLVPGDLNQGRLELLNLLVRYPGGLTEEEIRGGLVGKGAWAIPAIQERFGDEVDLLLAHGYIVEKGRSGQTTFFDLPSLSNFPTRYGKYRFGEYDKSVKPEEKLEEYILPNITEIGKN